MTEKKTATRFDELLFERERIGVLTLTYVRGLYCVFVGVSHWLIGASQFEKNTVAILTFTFLILIGLSVFMLRQGRFVRPIGFLGSLLDISLIAALPVIWYLSVGGTDIPPAYMMKSQITVMTLLFIVFNGLAIRPLYPIMVAVGGFLVHLALFIYILSEPRTIVSTNFVQSVMGPAISKDFVFNSMIIIVISGLTLGYITHLARRAVVQGMRLEITNAHLGRYFSPGVVAKISSDTESLMGVGGRKQEVAVLFCDIRNFTTLTENMDPSDVVQFLSDYHSTMVEVIFKFGGTIDKFIGDAIMVTFGTPDPAKDDVERAVRTGLAMNRALITINQKRLEKGLNSISHGIGIHFGPVIAGNIGTEDRLEYTVMGDTVNVASRIQDACKITGETFLISDAVKEKLPQDIKVHPLPEQHVKGRQKPVQIYAVPG